jgi:hypothetical protein
MTPFTDEGLRTCRDRSSNQFVGPGSNQDVITRLRCGGAALLVTLLSCGGEQKSDAPFDIQLPEPKVLVSGDSAHLSSRLDMTLDSQGRIWIADAMNKKVVVFDHDGKLIQTIGRAGDGPGEFRMPFKIAANDTVVRVYDLMHAAVQVYRSDGTYLVNHRGPRATLGAALSAEGTLVNSVNGMDSALATIYSLDDSATTRLGPLVAPPIAQPRAGHLFDLSNAIKAEVQKGRIATEARNMVSPAIGSHGTVWLLVQAEHEIRKYSADGSLLWRHPLDVPEAETALKEFFRTTAALKPNEPAWPPMTMDAAREIGGSLWILMHGEAGQPSVFYLLDTGTGRVKGRLSVQTPAAARGFNIDAARKRLYLIIPDEADILSVDLGSATGISWE